LAEGTGESAPRSRRGDDHPRGGRRDDRRGAAGDDLPLCLRRQFLVPVGPAVPYLWRWRSELGHPRHERVPPGRRSGQGDEALRRRDDGLVRDCRGLATTARGGIIMTERAPESPPTNETAETPSERLKRELAALRQTFRMLEDVDLQTSDLVAR